MHRSRQARAGGIHGARESLCEPVGKGIERNAPPAEHAALAARVQRFADQISATGTVRKGAVIDLDLDPQRGLLFTMNGTLRGAPVEGEDFYAALLRAFIGEHPYDERLKAGLLGSTPR